MRCKSLLYALALGFVSMAEAQNTLHVRPDTIVTNMQMAKWITMDSVFSPVMYVSNGSVKNKWTIENVKLKDGRPKFSSSASFQHFFNIYDLFLDTLHHTSALIAATDTLYKDSSRIRQLPCIITTSRDTIRSIQSFYYPYFDKTGKTAYLDTSGQSFYRSYDNQSTNVSQVFGDSKVDKLFPSNSLGISILHFTDKGYALFDVNSNKLLEPAQFYKDSLYAFSEDLFIAVDNGVRAIITIFSPISKSFTPILGYEILKSHRPVIKIQQPNSTYSLLIDKNTTIDLNDYSEKLNDGLLLFPCEDSLLMRLSRPDTTENPACPDSISFYYLINLAGGIGTKPQLIYKSSLDARRTLPFYGNWFINPLANDIFNIASATHKKFFAPLRAVYKLESPDHLKEADFFVVTGADTAIQVQLLRLYASSSTTPIIEAVSTNNLVTSGPNWHTFQQNILMIKDKSKGWRCFDGYMAITKGQIYPGIAPDGSFLADPNSHIYYVTTLMPANSNYRYQFRAMLVGKLSTNKKINYQQYYLEYKGPSPKPKEKSSGSETTNNSNQKKSQSQQHVK